MNMQERVAIIRDYQTLLGSVGINADAQQVMDLLSNFRRLSVNTLVEIISESAACIQEKLSKPL